MKTQYLNNWFFVIWKFNQIRFLEISLNIKFGLTVIESAITKASPQLDKH